MTERRHAEPLPLGGAGEMPYSKGLMARALIVTGVAPARAYELAMRIEADLSSRRRQTVELDRLHDLAIEILGELEGSRAVERLRRYRELQELDVPLILLIGGATGTGKSTIATEAAYRFGITRVTSTDIIRQTMRAFFSKEFMPSIHYSSFEAARALRAPEEAEDPAVAGFREQTRNVLVGVRAVLDRALEEGWSMVLEGVHLVPGMLKLPAEGALVVQCVVAIADDDAHASHFVLRDAVTQGVRPMEKYMDRFREIRAIQDYILSRAEKTGVPVVQNVNIDATIGDVMELMLASAEKLEQVGR